MEIIRREAYGTQTGTAFHTSIRTSFPPVEIIAIRPDGASESTNPEALKLREQAIKSTIESYEQNRKLIAADVATLRNEIARLDAARVKEIEQLKLEAGRLGLGIIDAHLRGRAELEPEVNRLKAELECSNGDFRQLEAMKERLESDLKAASAEVERLRWVDHEDILKGRAEIARLRAEVLEAQEARDRFKRERDEANIKLGVAEFQEQIDITRGNRLSDEVRKLTSELKSAKADYAELAKRHDELSAINVENYHNAIQAKAELERLKTTYSMDRVHGMTLEEVRGMKYQLAANREQIDAANARVASVSADLYNTEDMNKKLLARLELIRSRLGCQFGAIEMKVYELQQVQCKLDAVTRALAG